MTDKTFDKYKLVVDEWFVNGFNGVKAYQKFYPKAKDQTADKRFRDLTETDRIKTYIESKKQDAQETLGTSHEALLKELQNWAYSDITQTLNLTPDEVKALPDDVRRLITKYKHTQRHIRDNQGKITETVDTVELWFVDKTKAIEMINRHTGFYEKDNSQKAPPSFVVFDARKKQ